MSIPAPAPQDALALLRSDHRRCEALFADYDRLVRGGASPADRDALIARIGGVLRAHAQVENELFYPALGLADGDRAHADHERALALLEQVAAGAGTTDALVAELIAAVRDHVAFEEAELFPRAVGIDLSELGARMAVRRAELQGDQGPD